MTGLVATQMSGQPNTLGDNTSDRPSRTTSLAANGQTASLIPGTCPRSSPSDQRTAWCRTSASRARPAGVVVELPLEAVAGRAVVVGVAPGAFGIGGADGLEFFFQRGHVDVRRGTRTPGRTCRPVNPVRISVPRTCASNGRAPPDPRQVHRVLAGFLEYVHSLKCLIDHRRGRVAGRGRGAGDPAAAGVAGLSRAGIRRGLRRAEGDLRGIPFSAGWRGRSRRRRRPVRHRRPATRLR